MTEIELIIDKIKNVIKDGQVAASISDMPGGKKYRFTTPVVSVGLAGSSGMSAGFLGYIGTEYDADTDTYSEIYGKRLELKLSLDIRTPAGDLGGDECIAVFSQIVNLLEDLGSGIKVREYSCGDVSYDKNLDMYCCRAEVSCTAFLYAKKSDDSTEFTDFTLKGELV